MFRLTETVIHILFINAIIFFGVGSLLPSVFKVLPMYPFDSGHFKIWQPLTYMFAHRDFGHLFFNMLSLAFLGPWIEQYLGRKKFITFYLVCGLGGAVLHFSYFYLLRQISGDVELAIPAILGASAAINGIFLSVALLYPNVEMMIFPLPVAVKAKYLLTFAIALDFFFGMSDGYFNFSTGIAHFAHLGGALFAFLYLKSQVP